MKTIMRGWSPLAGLVLAATATAPVSTYGQTPAEAGGDVFTLEAAYREARTRNPMLRAAAAVADATATREASAGLPPDPMIQLGIMNFSVPGLETNMPTSMAPSIQAMQMLPLFGKLGLSGRVAQNTAIARSGAEERWWDVRSRTAMAFYMIYEADRQLEVMRETFRLLQDFEKVAKALYSAG